MNQMMIPRLFITLIKGFGQKELKKLEKDLRAAVSGCQDGEKTSVTLTVRIYPLDAQDRVTVECLSTFYVPPLKSDPVEMELSPQGYLEPVADQISIEDILPEESLGVMPEVSTQEMPGEIFLILSKSFGSRTLGLLDQLLTEVYSGVKNAREMGTVSVTIEFYPGASARKFAVRVRPQVHVPLGKVERHTVELNDQGLLVAEKQQLGFDEMIDIAAGSHSKEGILKLKKKLEESQ